MEINSSIQPYMFEIVELFRTHKVKSAYLFGSAVTNRYKDSSDLDFLINFHDNLDPLEKGELWWNLHDALRDILNREVDLIAESSLKNPYLIREIDNTKVKIYG